jgi:hypothetical protein
MGDRCPFWAKEGDMRVQIHVLHDIFFPNTVRERTPTIKADPRVETEAVDHRDASRYSTIGDTCSPQTGGPIPSLQNSQLSIMMTEKSTECCLLLWNFFGRGMADWSMCQKPTSRLVEGLTEIKPRQRLITVPVDTVRVG